MATITSAGVLTPKKAGAVKVGATYNGAPWVWYRTVTIKSWGCKPYNEISSSSNTNYSAMNCHGYALWSTKNLHCDSWFSMSNTQLKQTQTSNEFLEIFQPQFEKWLNDNIGSNKWENVTNNGGINATLSDNQWLVVMRVGFHPEFAGTDYWFDYHFWYRTDTGEWVNKHGYYSYSQRLGTDLPTDNTSIGWNCNIAQYYNSNLVYYRITE